jgi:hypothetical protein
MHLTGNQFGSDYNFKATFFVNCHFENSAGAFMYIGGQCKVDIGYFYSLTRMAKF